jgi:dihydroorotase-like cyclic amidohydrolase
MDYTLLKNGKIVHPDCVFNGDILLSNSRIVTTGENISPPDPETRVIDVGGTWLLPGLIHFKTPLFKIEGSGPSSGIYQALSHGSTFLMDKIKIPKHEDYKTILEDAGKYCQPIICDFSLHLDAQSCSKMKRDDLAYCFIHKGISSFSMQWKHVHKLLAGDFDSLLQFMAKHQLLLIFCTKAIKESSLVGNQTFFSAYLIKLREAVRHISMTGCPLLITGVSSMDEVRTIRTIGGGQTYIAVNLCNTELDVPSPVSPELIAEYGRLMNNIILDPPALKPPTDRQNYIENNISYSFLHELTDDILVDETYMVNLCNMYATLPAKLLGIYPQKGALIAGADADIIVWSPSNGQDVARHGENISILKADIKYLVVSGRLIEGSEHIKPNSLNGRYIFRDPVIDQPYKDSILLP